MIVRTENHAISEIHKEEVPTDLMKAEDVPGCTSFEDCPKEESAQGHATISLRLSVTSEGARWKANSPEGECSFWHCYYSLLGFTHCSPVG